MKLALVPLYLLPALAAWGRDSESLRAELRDQSRSIGLALVSSIAGDVVLIPFDAPDKYMDSQYRSAIAALGKAGRMVLWWSKSSFLDFRGEYTIESAQGQTIAGGMPRVSGFHPLAISETAKRIAFRANAGAPDTTSLNWASFDFGIQGFVDVAAGFPDWSPTGELLVYDNGTEVRIFDIAQKTSSRLAAGRDATWSPNGKWIAFANSAGRATLSTDKGALLPWAFDGHHPLGAVRWSPDGKYISFAEEAGQGPRAFGPAYRLIVGRVADGETVTVREFSAGSIGYNAFEWIVSYRDFCPKCTPVSRPASKH